MMRIGILQFSLTIRWARSLKDKRQVVKSLKDRLRNRFNVSVAEIEDQDLPQTATLGIVMAGNDGRYINGALDKILNILREYPDADLEGHSIEVL